LKGTTIRKLEAKDLDFAYKMVSTEEWNDREADLRRMLNCELEGCFFAEVDDEPAGHVFSIGYEKLGWIGLLIVDVNHRNKGIATMLMERAMDYLLGHGLETIKLEAVPEVAGLYRKLGFVDEYDSLRFVGTSRKQATLKSQCTNINRTEDLLEIGRFDAEYFGADRTKVLSRLCKEFPELCLVSRSKSGVNGYIMCREAAVGYKLGPWMCKPESPRSNNAPHSLPIQDKARRKSLYRGASPEHDCGRNSARARFSTILKKYSNALWKGAS
jgi:GNAT superfamily N-acetyltransferase